MLLINLFFTIFGWSLIFYLNYKFLRPASINKERFRLFELRDCLASLAMAGKISTTSDEYKALSYLLNTSIKELNNFSITSYIRFISGHVLHLQSKKKAKTIIALMDQHNDANYKKLVYSFYSITNNIFLRHTRLFRYSFLPLIKAIVKYISFVTFINKTIPELLMNKINRVEEIKLSLADVDNNYVHI